jgi:mxaJ protein
MRNLLLKPRRTPAGPKSCPTCGLFIALAVAVVVGACTTTSRASSAPPVLRVCADPNNLPFSNARLEGFENRLAELVARELRSEVRYTWWAQRRGFLRQTLNARACDIVMGLPTSMEMALTTRPYYRSSYVFVSRRDRHLRLTSFDDRILARLRVGVPLVGDDGGNSPPAHALSRRGLVRTIVGYSVYGDYAAESPAAGLIAAVATGHVDAAVAWGPTAGYFAARQPVALEIVPVSPEIDLPFLPFVYDISMAVRRDDAALRDRLDRIIMERRREIDEILAAYRVPRIDGGDLPS